MGNTNSVTDSQGAFVPGDLDVLQPGRPLHVLLSSVGPDVSSADNEPASSELQLSSLPPIVSSISRPAPKFGEDGSTITTEEVALGEPKSPTTLQIQKQQQRKRLCLPNDPDHYFWAALFRDYVVFDLAARTPHRSALRALCADAVRAVLTNGDPGAGATQPHAPNWPESESAGAAKVTHSPAARAVALTIRAAIPRLRDYAEDSSASGEAGYKLASSSPEQAKEVLGALMLSARVLSALSETCNISALCLVLGSDGPHDLLSATDRRDIGHSVVWQLLTCALDCIARPHSRDPVAPNIALAAMNLVLVALSTTYLAPSDTAVNSSRNCEKSRSEAQDRVAGSCQTAMMASIIDRYARPNEVLTSLLELVVDAARYHDVSNGALTSTPLSSSATAPSMPKKRHTYGDAGQSDFSRGHGGDTENLVASVSRRVSNAFLPRQTPAHNPATGLPLSPPSQPPSSFLETLTSHLPSPRAGTLLLSPSLLWSSQVQSPFSEGFSPVPSPPPPTPSSSSTTIEESRVGKSGIPPLRSGRETTEATVLAPGETEDKLSSTPSSILRGPSSPHSQSVTRIIARAPTLLGEQALALVALLCSPRKYEISKGSDMPFGKGEDVAMSSASLEPEVSRENPYRSALCSLHDLPQRAIGDDSAYSFGRLYEALAAWADDPRGALVVYHLVVGNRRFRTFVLARTDPDVLLLPLLASIYTRASPTTPCAPADAYIPAIILLILSSDHGFSSGIDEIFVPQSSLVWLEERSRLSCTDVSLSGLLLLVCIRCVQQSTLSKRRVMESYLAATCMSVMGNISKSVTGINNLAADRLVALTDFLGKRWRKSSLLALDGKDPTTDIPPMANGKVLLSPQYRSDHTVCSAPRQMPRENNQARRQSRDSSIVSATKAVPSCPTSGELSADNHSSEPNTCGKARSNSDKLLAVDIAFAMCGMELTEKEIEATVADLHGTLLEVVASILRSRSNISVNRHLMYSLLHREAVFDADYISMVSSRSRVIVARIQAVISFFSKHLDQPGFDATSTGMTRRAISSMGHGGNRRNGQTSRARSFGGASEPMRSDGPPSIGSSTVPSSCPGISVDWVFSVIDQFARFLPRDLLFTLPDLHFSYCQGPNPGEFVLPYAWVLAMRGSPLQWDPAQFPDSKIPIANATFHPARPPHGYADRRMDPQRLTRFET